MTLREFRCLSNDTAGLVSIPRCTVLSVPFRDRGGKHGHTHTWTEILNPSTSAKLVMTKLQNLFVSLTNMYIFQMTLKLSLFTVDS